MRVNGWARDEAEMLGMTKEALVVMQRSAEGSEGASRSEADGRGAPFCMRRRHVTTWV